MATCNRTFITLMTGFIHHLVTRNIITHINHLLLTIVEGPVSLKSFAFGTLITKRTEITPTVESLFVCQFVTALDTERSPSHTYAWSHIPLNPWYPEGLYVIKNPRAKIYHI
jgi:hypothetical protein